MARKWLRLSGWQRQQTRCVQAERLEEGLDEREKRQRPGASRRRPWRCGLCEPSQAGPWGLPPRFPAGGLPGRSLAPSVVGVETGRAQGSPAWGPH